MSEKKKVPVSGDPAIRTARRRRLCKHLHAAGPRPGRVEFEFYSGADSSLRLIIEIDRYRAEAQDLEGAELFKHFRPAP